MQEAPTISTSNVTLIDAIALTVGSGVLRILSDFSMAADGCEHVEALEEARKEALIKMQAEMSSKASKFIRSRFPNLSQMTEKGETDTNNNLELWKERYRRRLDANLKLIQNSKLLVIPDDLAQKIIQTALKNIHRITQDATLDLANAQMKICENPDSWSVDPTIRVKVMRRRNSKT